MGGKAVKLAMKNMTNAWYFCSGVARQDSSDEGAKLLLSWYHKCRKNSFHFPTGLLACFDGGYSPLAHLLALLLFVFSMLCVRPKKVERAPGDHQAVVF